MTTIEVNIETYNSLLSKLKEEEEKNIKLVKEVKRLNQALEDKKDNLDIFREANWYDRVFGWKQILKLTTEDEVQ